MSVYDTPKAGVGMRRGDVDGVDPGLDCSKVPSMTQQQFKDECDINVLLKNYEKGKAITHLNKYDGDYGDVTGAVDYHTACNIVLAAETAFETVPAQVRERFKNDPGAFLDFASDAANADEMRELGLMREIPAPARVEVVAGQPGGAAPAAPSAPGGGNAS